VECAQGTFSSLGLLLSFAAAGSAWHSYRITRRLKKWSDDRDELLSRAVDQAKYWHGECLKQAQQHAQEIHDLRSDKNV
jgi:hypothetical protein